jgi:hypothetical protein
MEQFWRLFSSDYIVIVVVYILYLTDAIGRRRVDEIDVSFSPTPHYFFSNSPFLWVGRVLSFSRLFQPWQLIRTERLAVSTPWLEPRESQIRYIRLLRASIQPVVFFSICNGLLLLFVLPILTASYGLSGALLFCAPLVYLNSLFILVRVYFSSARRRMMKMSWVGFISDFLLCPPYSINAGQRVFQLYELPFRMSDFMIHFDAKDGVNAPLRDIHSHLAFEREEVNGQPLPVERAIEAYLRDEHEG